LENFKRALKKYNEDNGTDYEHKNMFPCPVEGCLFFGLSKQLFKTKQQVPGYDLPRIDGRVDMSENAWGYLAASDQFCLTLGRHFAHNLDPANRSIVLEEMCEAHARNVPPCLPMVCRRSKDKNYAKLRTLLDIPEPDDDDDE
jgi:hypothetical protein